MNRPWPQNLMAALVSGIVCLPHGARADVKPHALLTDGMVLQQRTQVQLWGTADDGERIVARFRGREVAATAAGGRWSVHVDSGEPGGPFSLTIAAKNAITLKN